MGVVDVRRNDGPPFQPAMQLLEEKVYQCRALLCPESEGGYSIVSLDLPGVATQGESAEEAIANFVDAFRVTVASYRDDNQPIPWQEVDVEEGPDCKELRIAVNA